LTLVDAQRHKDIPKGKKVLRCEKTYTHVLFNWKKIIEIKQITLLVEVLEINGCIEVLEIHTSLHTQNELICKEEKITKVSNSDYY